MDRGSVESGQRRRNGESRKVNLPFVCVCVCVREKKGEERENEGTTNRRKDAQIEGETKRDGERNEDVEGEKENLYS